MRNRGYNSYRGRSSGKKIALVVVLVVLLLLSAAYLLLQDRIIYRSDGSIGLDLPFLQGDQLPADDGESLPVEILPDDDEDAPGETTAPLLAREVSAAELTAETLAALQTEGYNGIVVEMKGFNGMFAYTSAHATSQALEENAVSAAAVKEALEGHGDRTAVAKVDCFHDSFHAFADMAGSGICQSNGYIWYDELSSHWMDPAKEGTQTYLAGVVRECVDMGFDEILLTGFTYPAGGDQSQIDDSGRTMTKTEALAQCLAALREAAGEETLLSLQLSQEELLSGRDEVSGMDPAVLLPLVDRVYVTELTDRAAAESVLEECGSTATLAEVSDDGSGVTVYSE